MTVVVDAEGLVTAVGEPGSVRELVRILSRWYQLPSIQLDTVPDAPRTMRIERVPIAQVVRQLLPNLERAGLRIPSRPGRRVRTRPSSFLMMVHDGQGAVTVSGEQASTREVLGLLSRWFHFPIVNPDTIPDDVRSMQFDRLMVDQLVDRLLRGVSVNYVILTNPRTLVPTKVVAAPLSASAGYQAPPVARPGTWGAPASPGDMPMPGSPGEYMPPASGFPMPLPPAEGAMPPVQPMPASPSQPMPNYPVDPNMLPRDPSLPGPQPTTPFPAPGATRPGLIVPPAQPPGAATGIKPPGPPRD
jgi:hypothetical protein